MSACPACGHHNQAGAKFCSQCAAPMAGAGADVQHERKVVTILFADLVSFTSRSERLDPEDVRAFLSPYYARLRVELERFGGTVEKFIGDAVMAVFGAPVAHEDDPERAVRAALAIRDRVEEQEAGLKLRIAVNTGEVLVALGARLADGEGMVSGDVVNTTARLQAAAPVNGILVGETTYRATSSTIVYRPVEPVTAKGKTDPVPAWEALEARSRLGVDLASANRTPMVGRSHELGALTDALARARRERSTQLVTIVSVPGLGKSRLVAELGRLVDEETDLVYWRQGRSLPYGDGVTFWALAEMVKAQAGILDTDPPEQTDLKLRSSVAELLPDQADARWVEAHLRPLVGLGVAPEAVGDRRDEAFTAWRRYFEALAEKSPLTLVFEDLHWADDDLLDFVEHLVDWISQVPILVLCSARPELLERRPGWGGASRNATRLSLSRLSDDETALLISNLSERPVMDAGTQQALLSRAGGNPLYAEQYVRMLAERGEAGAMSLPETVQGIIAARLDALPAEEKTLLHTAAVMGKVFWLGAVTHVGGLDRRTSELRLHGLERKEFVQRVRRSSVAEEQEYAFLHVLLRDVAYRQIPRARRAEQHRLAAEWIGSLGRTEDSAEMLAHHYVSAIELRRAAGQSIDDQLAARALDSLHEAGDRALSLNAHAAAARFYRTAAELSPAASLERARLLFKLGRAQFLTGDLDEDVLTTACAELAAAGDHEAAAEAEAVLAEVSWYRGDRDQAFAHLGRARELVAGDEPSRAKAYVTSALARFLMIASEHADAIRIGREALAMAELLGLDDLRSHSLNTIGIARVNSGSPDGLADLQRSLATAEAVNAPGEICRALGNIAMVHTQRGDLRQAAALSEEAAAVAARFGLARDRRWFLGEQAVSNFDLGRWQQGLAAADEIIAEVEQGSPHYQAAACHATRAQIRLGYDDVAGAVADAGRALEMARHNRDLQNLHPIRIVCAHIFNETGAIDAAAQLLDEVIADMRSGAAEGLFQSLHVLAWAMTAQGRADEFLDVLPKADTLWTRAADAFARGDLRRAIDTCVEMGAASEEAHDRLWLGQALARENLRAEADAELERALAFYRTVGATRYIRVAESLLTASA